jgi:hypothetical protein
MTPGLGRLRFGEWLAAVAAIVLVASLPALHWYGGIHPRTGWEALPTLRWVVLVTVVVTLAAVVAQLRRGPALSAALDVVALLLSTVTTILLVIRLATTGASLSAGAFVGLAASIVMGLGAFAALRTEQGWTPGPGHPVEVVSLTPPGDA